MGASSTLRATGLDFMAPGALGAGPEAGGGVSGPVDWAARVTAKKREASGKQASLSDLEIVVVDPDTAFEIALFFREDLRSEVKHVSGKVVDFLAADIGDVVLGKFVGGEGEGLDFFQVVQVFLGHLNFCKCVGGGISNFFDALPFLGKKNVALDFVVAIGNIVGVEGLHLEILGPSVSAEKLFELGFFCGEFLDDLIRRKRRRFFGDGGILDFARSGFRFDCAGRAWCRTGGWRGRERASGLGNEGCGEEERGERKREAGEPRRIQAAKQTWLLRR